MKDITVIVPLLSEQVVSTKLDEAIESLKRCQEYYKDGNLKLLMVVPKSCEYDYPYYEELQSKVIVNDGETDYCSQINFAVDHVDTEYFSILEYDDEYKPKWFKFANEYSFGNEDVSIFIPLNVVTDKDGKHWQYCNEVALAKDATKELGFIDFECLENWSGFNLTGAIFNTQDFIKCGKYKPSIKIAFNYELLLRMANKGLKLMVVPKEGYIHLIGMKGSLTEQYNKEIAKEDIQKWFDLAKREYSYDVDRNKGITVKKDVELS